MADLFWLSDDQWAVIEPFMPRHLPGPERKDDRRIISGILHVITAGCRWCDCPATCGPSTTVYDRFNRLTDLRRIATRYDKLACNYASILALAAIIAFRC